MSEYTMMGHITDQPRALRYCFENNAYARETANILTKSRIKKVYVVGSGTSYSAAVVIKYYIQRYWSADAQFISPHLFTYHENQNASGAFKNDEILVIGISQSGSSTSTLSALDKAKKSGNLVLGVTEDENSAMAKADYPYLHLLCGKENVPPETRGYTVTLMMLYLITLEVAKKLGNITAGEYESKLAEAREFTLRFDTFIKESAEWYDRNKDELEAAGKLGVTAYGMNYGTALEAQVKLYECTHLASIGYEAEEFIHGPIFAYDEENYIFTILSGGSEMKRAAVLNQFFKEKVTPHVFVISAEDIPHTIRDCRFSYNACEELMAIAYIIPFQILAARLADKFGINTTYFKLVHVGWPAYS
ncbi:MAG: SIS domain-containing protein [Bacillota bacterium]|nr:SIS domain-containing protein [Bacillota bacterium]